MAGTTNYLKTSELFFLWSPSNLGIYLTGKASTINTEYNILR